MFEPGSQLGRYEIQRRIGRGGMGSVYVAHDPVLGRMVAIKVFAGDLDVPDARERFSREARAAAALSHPNIVTVFDFGSYDSQPYIVMEYVAGETVAGLIRRKVPVTMADKLRWMEELVAGVGYAHQMQLVHRDIKPANLMVDRSGRLKILDFGIARMLGTASNTTVMIGTPGYMAPEQITGDPVDHRADQFSIGVVFYELLTYKEAFPGDTLPMITHKVLTEDPVPLERLAPDVSAEIVRIVVKTLKKSPAERYDNSEALRAAIGRAREFSSNAAWNAPTVLGGDTPHATTGSRGTGSARRRQDDAVGVAQLTPPPDPRRSDREAIARRRTAQIDRSLQQARALLAQGDLDAALDACQEALTFDETHAAALDLEAEIHVAVALRERAARASAVTAATPLYEPPASDDVALADAVTRLDEQPRATPGGFPGRTTATPPVPKAPAAKAMRDKRTFAGLAAGVVLLVAVAGGLMLLGPARTGSVVIDAAPWGTITSIELQSGAPQQLPADATTPVLLMLPAGEYRVTVAGPSPASPPQQVNIRVDPGAQVVAPLVRFHVLTPEEYFEEYLASPSAAGDAATAEPIEAAPPPAPAGATP